MKSPEEEIRKQADELRKLQERVESLSKQLYRHTRDPYLIAHQIFGALSFYREHYASGGEYQERLQEILKILRGWGKADWQHTGVLGAGKFLMGLADLLEEANKTGGWPGLKEAQ